MAFVLKGARVAGPDSVRDADVRVEGGRIFAVGDEIARQGDGIFDVSGKIILPGGIDAHTHFDLPLNDGERTADSFATGSRAALAGGTTCIVDYATQFKGETLSEGLANWHALADGKCRCDYSFHLAMTDWRPELVRDLPEIIEQGVTSFKMYMAYKGTLQVDDGVLYEALDKLEKIGGLLCVHCENGDIIAERTRELLSAGKTGPEYHPVSRPGELETEAAGRLLAIASLAGAPVYVVHISAAATMRRVVEAKISGVRAYAETCPQYLYLDDSLYEKNGWEAAKYVCSPPLRGAENHKELWNALASNLIDTVSTDHCSFNFATQKEKGRGDFSKIPNGMPGVESRVLLMYKAVADGTITLPQMVRLTSTNPAKIFGMSPRKGAIAPGADADIVVLDPNGTTAFSEAKQYQNVDYTPFEGFTVPASIESVYLRGVKVFEKGTFTGEAEGHAGIFIHRGPSGVEGV